MSFKDIRTFIEVEQCDPESGLAMLDVLNILSGKWKVIILCTLLMRERRYTEIHRLIPTITPRMLSKELKNLEMDGVVQRTVSESMSVKYSLTPSGKRLIPVMESFVAWGVDHRRLIKQN